MKLGLQSNVAQMKGLLRKFLVTCKSEELLETRGGPIHVEHPIGGLGLQFGYRSDTTKEKDAKKLQSWTKYFEGMVKQVAYMKYISSSLSFCRKWKKSYNWSSTFHVLQDG